MSLRGSGAAFLSLARPTCRTGQLFVVGAVLCSAECLASPLTLVVPTPPRGVNQKFLQMLPDALRGANCPGGAPLPCGHQFHVTPAPTSKENRQVLLATASLGKLRFNNVKR